MTLDKLRRVEKLARAAHTLAVDAYTDEARGNLGGTTRRERRQMIDAAVRAFDELLLELGCATRAEHRDIARVEGARRAPVRPKVVNFVEAIARIRARKEAL